MSAQIKEALEVAKRMRAYPHSVAPQYPADIAVVIEGLEAARQEAEAWEAIYQWWDSGPRQELLRVTFLGSDGECARVHLRLSGAGVNEFQGATRIEALTKAADWCRAELAK